MKKKPFFYFEELKPFDALVIVLYVIFTLGLVVVYNVANNETIVKVQIAYMVLPQLFIYTFFYVSLRNLKAFTAWFFITLIHLIIYFVFIRKDQTNKYWYPSLGFLNTIILLILYQILRYISLKLQRREFVSPAKGGGLDLIENKKLTATDYFLFVIYFLSWWALTMIGPFNYFNL